MSDTDRFVAETTFHVRYAETDAMGIVHHSAYVIYLEEGRSAYARQRGYPYSQMEDDGVYLAVTEVNLRYLQSARYEQLITVRTWIDQVRSRGMTFGYEIVDTNSGEHLVTGTTKHLCLDRQGKITRLPANWQDW